MFFHLQHGFDGQPLVLFFLLNHVIQLCCSSVYLSVKFPVSLSSEIDASF